VNSRWLIVAILLIAIATGITFFAWPVKTIQPRRVGQPTSKSDAPSSNDPSTTIAEPNRVPSSAPTIAEPKQEFPVRVFYVDPTQYVTNHVQFVKDRSGKTQLNTILLPKDLPPATGKSDLKAGGFAGADSCAECHKDYYDGYIQTSHYKTSAKAGPTSILGSFETGKNKLETKSPSLRFEMEKDEDVFLQRMLVDSKGESFGADFEFGIVTGSGKIAQSYLHWKDDRLYQLPVSYLTKKGCWVNSPGYLDGTANFARPVLAPCLECHATYFESIGGTTNHFRTDNFILGISCERCHGPGRQHVAYHHDHPDEKEGHAVVNPANLTSERSADMCQVCHGGLPKSMKQPAFTYRVGHNLSEHYEFAKTAGDGPVPIHSNSQLPRLQKSKCFQESKNLGCTDCHNPHKFERGDFALFSERCIRCHEPNRCGKFKELGESIRENCIECHMPPNQAEDIGFNMEGSVIKPLMRDHHIRVSPEATADFLRSRR
jgi:Cytochrome c554 and c-prime